LIKEKKFIIEYNINGNITCRDTALLSIDALPPGPFTNFVLNYNGDIITSGITSDFGSNGGIQLNKITANLNGSLTNLSLGSLSNGINIDDNSILTIDNFDINVWELIKLANRHPRVNILQPGPGVGGHCIAVDPWFIVDSAPDEAKLIKLARLVNDEKPYFVIKKVKQAVSNISKDVSELSIASLGLSFKPDIDDLRESPALEIAKQVSDMGFKKQYIVEPNIKDLPDEFNSQFTKLVELERALISSDILLLLVDHLTFKEINLSLLSGKQVIDTRGTWVGV
jgi:hypothetical protein